MAFKLGNYLFVGPHTSIDSLKDWSGVYAIVCKTETEYFLLDVGESSKVRTRIENHDKKECWIKNCKGQLTIFVHYTPFVKQHKRIFIEKELRNLYNPTCYTDRKIW